jgi:hypothetical protein
MPNAEKNYQQWIILTLIMLAIVAVRVPFLIGEVQGGDAVYHARAAVVVLNGGAIVS